MTADRLILRGGALLDVAEGRILRGDVAIRDGLIEAVGELPPGSEQGARVLDVTGRYVSPGFIDSHLHIESSMLGPLEFARTAVAHGTTAVFVDPHEIANVCGRAGIELFLRQAPLLPLDLYVGVPSCVPATGLEDAGAAISTEDIDALIDDAQVYGLAEMMNFPGIVHGLGTAREKVELVLGRGKIVDGHCPGLGGADLLAYVSNGHNDGQVRIMSDHESRSAAEAMEKRRAGLQVALRYGSASKDLPRILPGLLGEGFDLRGYMLCSDDLDPVELYRDGHVDRTIRKAREILMASGVEMEPATLQAIALATVNPARFFAPFFRLHGLPGQGEIAPGLKANLVVLGSLERLDVQTVLHGGRVVVEGGARPAPGPPFDYAPFEGPLHIPRAFGAGDFVIRHAGPARTAEVKVIGLTDGIETRLRTVPVSVRDGEPVAHPDLAKIAVIERHKATGTFAVGFVERCIARGAIASTVAHDSHNVICIGVDDGAMARAVNCLRDNGGGMVVAGEDLDYFPLRIAGLMSDEGIEAVVAGYGRLRQAVQAIGGQPDLFMKMSFLALPVIPELRITNRGLVDVNRFDLVPLY